jgi:MFS family permease
MAGANGAASSGDHQVDRHDVLVITASSVGTIFEWYDFYLYGSLATFISAHIFSGLNEASAFIVTLLAFAAGFFVRPFGALFFGRLGDLWGRKNTFLVTMLLMGLSTFGVALLPDYKTPGIGHWSPWILIGMRLVQGLALGGEYGGAATYVAEHAPNGKRGLYTSFIQITATFGLFLSLAVVLATRTQIGEDAFKAWGWRVPFAISLLLLIVSLWIRLQLNESPVFQRMISEGKGSKKPLMDSFGKPKNLALVIKALIGLTAGQAVVWYTGQFYALFFLEKTLKVDGPLTNIFVALALLAGTPFFVFWGWLSDKIGRKWIILSGCLIAACSYTFLFHTLTEAANPGLFTAAAAAPVTVYADPADCSLQFDPIGKTVFNKSCDVAKAYLTKAGVPYKNVATPAGSLARITVGTAALDSIAGDKLDAKAFKAANEKWGKAAGALLKAAHYPAKADPAKMNKPLVVGVLFALVFLVTMVYGPIAAMLVEMFPTSIRYTSMSLPYHIGNGWFGGFLPSIAFAMVAATGDIYYGLIYPIVVAAATFVLGALFVKETFKNDLQS